MHVKKRRRLERTQRILVVVNDFEPHSMEAKKTFNSLNNMKL